MLLVQQAPRAGAHHSVGGGAVRLLEVFDRGFDGVVEQVGIAGSAVRRVRRKLEPLAQQRDLLILHALLENGTVGNLDESSRSRLAASELDQLLAQRLELRLIGLEAAQIGGGLGADGDRFQHLERRGQRESRIEVVRQPRRVDPAAARVAA